MGVKYSQSAVVMMMMMIVVVVQKKTMQSSCVETRLSLGSRHRQADR